MPQEEENPGEDQGLEEIPSEDAVSEGETVTGYQILGGVHLGDQIEDDAKEISRRSQMMQKLQPVTVAAARALVLGATEAIRKAIDIAALSEVPGAETRKNVASHLQWHAEAIQKMIETPNAVYSHADDLKNWVLRAFIEASASQAGKDYIGRSRTFEKMYDEAASLAGKAKKGVLDTLKDVADTATAPFRAVSFLSKLPNTVLLIGGAIGVGFLGYGVYKIALAAAPSAGKSLGGGFLGRAG